MAGLCFFNCLSSSVTSIPSLSVGTENILYMKTMIELK